MLGTLGHEMILKVRVAGSEDPDYIEVELPGDSLTLESVININDVAGRKSVSPRRKV